MSHWLAELREDLARLAGRNMLRRLRPVENRGRIIRRDGRELVNLASNDYLGLSQHPHLCAAAAAAAQTHGAGAGASRLVGHLQLHQQVEQRFAAFKHAQAALLCPTGYMANHAVLTALAGAGDLICLDKLCHASLFDGARASGAAVRTYPHRQTAKLERLLHEHQHTTTAAGEGASVRRRPRRLVVTDSVFSMDGTVADLPALGALARAHEAILIVDEAHATGVLGATGAGLCEAQNAWEFVDVVISTASKALGGLGGIVTARQEVIDTLINRARSFIFTTGVPPAQAAALGAALDIVRDEPWRRQRVLELARRLVQALHDAGRCDRRFLPAQATGMTPIVPLVVGAAEAALDLAAHLEQAGFFAPAIRPPTVPPGTSRVRLCLRADLQDQDLQRLAAAVETWGFPIAN